MYSMALASTLSSIIFPFHSMYNFKVKVLLGYMVLRVLQDHCCRMNNLTIKKKLRSVCK